MFKIKSAICIVLAVLLLLNVSINPVSANSDLKPDSIITPHEPKSRMFEIRKDTGKKANETLVWIILAAVVVAMVIVANELNNPSKGTTTENYY